MIEEPKAFDDAVPGWLAKTSPRRTRADDRRVLITRPSGVCAGTLMHIYFCDAWRFQRRWRFFLATTSSSEPPSSLSILS